MTFATLRALNSLLNSFNWNVKKWYLMWVCGDRAKRVTDIWTDFTSFKSSLLLFPRSSWTLILLTKKIQNYSLLDFKTQNSLQMHIDSPMTENFSHGEPSERARWWYFGLLKHESWRSRAQGCEMLPYGMVEREKIAFQFGTAWLLKIRKPSIMFHFLNRCLLKFP